MPSITNIISMMAKLGVNEDSPDAALRSIYLTYVQSTYNEVYGEMASTFPTRLRATQDVTLVNGVGTLAVAPYQIIAVYNTSNNFAEVNPTTLDDQMEATPALADAGLPSSYWQDGLMTIKGYPLDNSTLRVLYIPNPSTLTESTLESDLVIPVPFQDLLTWGAMRYLRIDESDKQVGGELASCALMYEKLKGNLFYWLKNGQVRKTINVTKHLA